MTIRGIKLGADPELFIINKKDNSVVSSIGLIPGEKGNAWRSEDMPAGFGLEIDNILAEFNIPACSTRKKWIESINYMKDYIRKYVQAKNKDLDILCTASRFVGEDQLQSDEAKEFGCCPDYNVYTESQNEKPEGASTNLRSAGCHIHVSYNNNDVETSLMLIKYMDAFLGLNSVLLDDDVNRRSLYGKAGSFRICNYGFEYRTLSSKFISNDELIGFMWDYTMAAIIAFERGFVIPKFSYTMEAINNSDKEFAKKLIKDFNLNINN